MIKYISESKNIKYFDQPKILLINPISPNKFKEGGAAIFLEHNKNHHNEILGKNIIIPLLIKRLRLPKRS